METKAIVAIWVGIALFVLALVAAIMWIMPIYSVWHQHKAGEAELAKAEYSKQVLVQDAMAKEASAVHLANAEIARAEGVAKANKIIGDSLKDNESYLWYLWITGLEAAEAKGATVIYVPTEGQFPIMEAGRLGQRKKIEHK